MKHTIVPGVCLTILLSAVLASAQVGPNRLVARGIQVLPAGGGAAMGGFGTIQAAVDAASPGDTVFIPEGVYTGLGNKDVVVTKNLTIQGQGLPPATVIDCEGSGRGFQFSGAVDQTTTLMTVTVLNGNASQGGAVRLSGVDPVIRRCLFRDCTATSGGALYASGTTVRLVATDFVDNQAVVGGGMYLENVEGSVRGCHLFRNHADVVGGGAAVFAPLGVDPAASGMTFSDAVISGNSCDGSSAGLYAEFVDRITVDRCIVARNRAGSSTGGIGITGDFLIFFSDAAYVLNSLIVQNTAASNAGLTVAAVGAVIQNCTVADNAATEEVGGLTVVGDGIYMLNTILWGNTSNDPSVFEQQFRLAVPIQLFDNNDVEGGVLFDPTVISQDPLFVNPALGNYRLLPQSPCVDSGLTLANVAGQRDFERDPRLSGAAVDIGADEVDLGPQALLNTGSALTN